ncbi:ATP-binding protein [Winogradskyella sp.]|uniref:Dph6-related ATP pyrophosphatase n=1 Tax=Winogradskyella sp. TaxID=1883156 RepID=UPI002634B165|nr:ATP-binding protein [Winogradskyella sp.]
MFKTFFNWSTGKDSAIALYYLQNNNELSVDHLLTTMNSYHNRVSMHGLRRELLIKQIESIGLPYSTVELPEQPSMNQHNKLMRKEVNELKKQGFTDCGFGDIFLEDLRHYREQQLKDIKCHFPLWQKNTKALYLEFLNLGFKAIVICVNGELLNPSFVGRELDYKFLQELPNNVDPCGENGEFHTFCYDGPIFSHPIEFELGEKVLRQYNKPNGEINDKIDYWFLDLKDKTAHNNGHKC